MDAGSRHLFHRSAEKSQESSKNRAGTSKTITRENAKVIQDQNRHKSSVNSEESSSSAEENQDGAKNRAGTSKKIARENTKVIQDQNRHQPSIESKNESNTNAERA